MLPRGPARIHEHLASLPHGYETSVGERGVNLSGGQRQRLSIARGILPDPTVLIFDDSLSAVDTNTESALRAELASIARTRGDNYHSAPPERHCRRQRNHLSR